MRHVVANQNDPKTVPWQEGCEDCAYLARAEEKGLFTWILAVSLHFQEVHSIVLRSP